MQPIDVLTVPPSTSGNSPPTDGPQPRDKRAVDREIAPAEMPAPAPAPWLAQITWTQPVRREMMAGRGTAWAASSRQEHIHGAVRSGGTAARRTPVLRQRAWSAKPGQRLMQRGTVDAAGANDGRSLVLEQKPQIAKIPTGPYGPFRGAGGGHRRGSRACLRLAASDRKNPDRNPMDHFTVAGQGGDLGRGPASDRPPPIAKIPTGPYGPFHGCGAGRRPGPRTRRRPATANRKSSDRTLWTIPRSRRVARMPGLAASPCAAAANHKISTRPYGPRTMGTRAAAPGAWPPVARRPELQLPAATLCTLARQHRTARRPHASPRARQQGGSHDRTRHLRLRR